jgi:hypothetical protein
MGRIRSAAFLDRGRQKTSKRAGNDPQRSPTMRLASRQKYLTETNHEALNLSLKSQTNPANLSLESPAAHTETKKPHAESIKNAEFKESLLVDIRGNAFEDFNK